MSELVKSDRPICKATDEKGKCKGCVNDQVLCTAAGEVADEYKDKYEKMANVAIGLADLGNSLARRCNELADDVSYWRDRNE